MLFGSSGIRGIVNEKITPDLVRNLGMTLGRDNDEVIVGRDPRPTGHMLHSALVAGLTSVGSDVKDAGMVPTPTLAQAAENFDCGVMITASHNTAEYNGIKLWNPDGSSFNTEQTGRIEERLDDKKSLPSWDSVGKESLYEGATEEHIDRILRDFGDDHDLKVVVDCSNGAGSLVTPYLLKEMGCEVVTLNCQPDGTFPAHPSEPIEENLGELSKMVEKSDADLGIAHDGDADRMVAFDSTGRYLGGDELLAIFAEEFSDVVVPVNSSMLIEEVADNVNRCKVGDVFVSEMVKDIGAEFGGEPSGTWIFPKISYGPDGIYAAAFLVDMYEKIDIVEKVNELVSYPRSKISIETHKKSKVMDELVSLYKDRYSDDRLSFVDGIRFEEQDGWGLIRASGTEPKVRLTVESKEEEQLDKMIEKAKDNIDRVMEDIE